ncbi:hypothetical protein K504DRAFT_273419 [Pleomassaria siparia CBS 279.74]|uniref:Uncharacterized protein n=1 Tax=Pleomassaria siparia CBS 279.74 TaxID=1314801 RepID=A0A6G1K917_9PLEO|nr:hypothetical protein K504DRAFT_273419 [Pleomassaria siparia CBS 279.74]
MRTLDSSDRTPSGYLPKTLPTIIHLTSRDGVKTVIKIGEPKPRVPKRSMSIVVIPGASVEDAIFSLPTIPTNAVYCSTGFGYGIQVLVPRSGIGDAVEEG